jgi:hypothetical protein
MPVKLIAKNMKAIAELIKAVDAFSQGADHLDAMLDRASEDIPSLLERAPRDGDEKIRALRRDLFAVKDRMRHLGQLKKGIMKDLKVIGSQIFDIEKPWPEIMQGIGVEKKRLKEMMSIIDKLGADVQLMNQNINRLAKAAAKNGRPHKKKANA